MQWRQWIQCLSILDILFRDAINRIWMVEVVEWTLPHNFDGYTTGFWCPALTIAIMWLFVIHSDGQSFSFFRLGIILFFNLYCLLNDHYIKSEQNQDSGSDLIKNFRQQFSAPDPADAWTPLHQSMHLEITDNGRNESLVGGAERWINKLKTGWTALRLQSRTRK